MHEPSTGDTKAESRGGNTAGKDINIKPKRKTKAVLLVEAAEQQPSTDNYRCQQCQRCSGKYGKFIRPDYSKVGRILVVHGAPWEKGSTKDGFATGHIGYLIKHEILEKIGLKPQQLVYSGVVRCFNEDKLKVGQIDMCSSFLMQEIQQLQPTHVIGFGAHAVRAVTQDKKLTLTQVIRKPWHLTVGDTSVPSLFTYSPGIVMDGTDVGTLELIRRHITDFLNDKLYSKDFLPLEII